ncbi:MAG: type III pantothenate kinase [Bacteroidales bacterium]|nr:type III pantothenate kinase [Bacteroidales bacterium]
MIQKTDTNVIIDLGNTLFKVAVFDKNILLSIRVFKNGSYSRIGNYLKVLPQQSYCILSSVVNYPDTLKVLLNEHFKTIILNPGTALPVVNSYKTPETLGKDRIAAAVAAWHAFPGKNLLVIDAGTAITMDLVTNDGNFVGGAISPGIDMRFKALHTFTGKLPLVKRKNIKYLTGATTEESISTGVINGIAVEIDGIIDKYKLLYPDLTIIFGGGDSKFLHKRLKNSIFALPNPVINGLQIILNYNIENEKIL